MSAPPLAINHRLCLVVYAGAFTLGLPLNLVALVALGVAARRRRLLPADVLLLNLTVADLALVASLPVRMAEAAWEATWKLPPALCPLFVFLFFTSIYLTTLSLTALSVDRYLSAAFPVQYRQRRRAAHAAVAAAGSWAAALGHCSVVYVAQPGPAGNGTACYTRFAGPQLATLLALRLEIFLVLFCLPLAITAFCYGRLVCIVAALPTAALGRKRRVVALAAATTAAFILCFAPFNVSHVVGYVSLQRCPDTMLILIAYVLTFTVGLPANIFTFVTLLGKARRRVNPADILLLNLTIADLFLLLFLPFKMAEAAADMTWPLPIVLCPVANFCFYSSIYLSSLFLAALSVERYLGVVFPLQFKNRRRLGRTMAASAILWLLACSHCSIVFVAQYHDDGHRQSTVSKLGSFVDKGSRGFRPDGSMVNAFKPGGYGMSNPDGFNPNSFNPSGPIISSSDGPISTGFSPSSSGVSSPDNFNSKVFKIYNHNGSMVNGSKTSNGDISVPNGSRIPSPSGPKTYNSKVFTNNVATIPGISTADVSWTSDIHSMTVPNHLAASRSHNDTNSNSTYKCYDDFSQEQLSFVLPLRLELFLVLFLLPFAVTVFCYINFVRALLARPNIPLEKKQRAVGLAVATMVNFGVCFAPYNISHVVGFVLHKSPEWRSYILFLTSLNAALDPFIFYFSSTAIQKAVAGVVVAVRDKLRAMVVCCYGE